MLQVTNLFSSQNCIEASHGLRPVGMRGVNVAGTQNKLFLKIYSINLLAVARGGEETGVVSFLHHHVGDLRLVLLVQLLGY